MNFHRIQWWRQALEKAKCQKAISELFCNQQHIPKPGFAGKMINKHPRSSWGAMGNKRPRLKERYSLNTVMKQCYVFLMVWRKIFIMNSYKTFKEAQGKKEHHMKWTGWEGNNYCCNNTPCSEASSRSIHSVRHFLLFTCYLYFFLPFYHITCIIITLCDTWLGFTKVQLTKLKNELL